MDLIEDVALNVHRSKSVAEIAKEYKKTKGTIYNLIYRLRKSGVLIPTGQGSRIKRTIEKLKESNPEVFS